MRAAVRGEDNRNLTTQTNIMKRIFSILVLATAFGLALPATAEAADRKGKGKGKASHSKVARSGHGSHQSARVTVSSSRHSCRPAPIVVARRPVCMPRHYHHHAPLHGLIHALRHF